DAVAAKEMGCDDLEFNGTYGIILMESGRATEGAAEIVGLFSTENRMTDYDIDIVMDCFSYLTDWFSSLDDHFQRSSIKRTSAPLPLEQVIDPLNRFCQKYGARLKPYFELICHFALNAIPGETDDLSKLIHQIEELTSLARKFSRKPDEYFPEWFIREWKTMYIVLDERVHDHTRTMVSILYNAKDEVRDFQWLNAQLVILEELERFRVEKAVLAEDYREVAGEICEFLDTLASETKISDLHQKLERLYLSQMDDYSNGLYEVIFPEKYQEFVDKRKSKGLGSFDTPYKRSSKKIGRNDPCPCGSGKKYKLCHGRKQ
ncbi:MAG: SEC-C domain-containing protein, partial [Lachnospiraceae bacterium]|nr:SEC-C domain-containing protein [Lachnospiraceae bacterium]